MSHKEGECKDIKHEKVESQLKILQGKILTLMDAIFENPKQNKAVKDLVNKNFSDHLAYICMLSHPDLPVITEDQLQAVHGISTDDVIKNGKLVDKLESDKK